MAETLSYSIKIDIPVDPLKTTLDLLKNYVQNPLLEQLWSEEGFELFEEEKKKSYVILRDAIPKQKEVYIPDRVNRCALETIGRILRQGRSRKEVFDSLMEVSVDPADWSFQSLKDIGVYKKTHLINNIREQVENFIGKYRCQPEEFLALQDEPQLKNGIITYAPDDGQAGQFQSVKEDERWFLRGKIRLTETDCPQTLKDWTWFEFETELPEIISSKLEDGGKQVKPNLRIQYDKQGQLYPVLDYNIQVNATIDNTSRENYLALDWGINKIFTAIVVDKDGNQLTQPVFLKWNQWEKQLLNIRNEIDNLKSLKEKSTKADKITQLELQISLLWNKYKRLNKEIGHTVSKTILYLCDIYNCKCVIVEDLRSLRSKRDRIRGFSKRQKTLRWRIGTNCRGYIFDSLKYKSRQLGIAVETVNPYGTSQCCPHCGKHGIHVKSPTDLNDIKKSHSWFYCPHCHYQGDRDYCASQNIAVRGLNQLYRKLNRIKDFTVKCLNAVSYIGTARMKLFTSEVLDVARLYLKKLTGLVNATPLVLKYIFKHKCCFQDL